MEESTPPTSTANAMDTTRQKGNNQRKNRFVAIQNIQIPSKEFLSTYWTRLIPLIYKHFSKFGFIFRN